MWISVVSVSPSNCVPTFVARYLSYSCYRGREGPGAGWQLTYLAGSNLPIAPLSFYVFRQIDCNNVYSYTFAPLRFFGFAVGLRVDFPSPVRHLARSL